MYPKTYDLPGALVVANPSDKPGGLDKNFVVRFTDSQAKSWDDYMCALWNARAEEGL